MKQKLENYFLIYICFGVLAVCLVACSDEAVPLNSQEPDNGGSTTISWAAVADSIQDATYLTYLGDAGTYIQDNQGNTSFNYWHNAHVLNTLVDAYTRTDNGAYVPKMIALLNGIKSKNGDTFSNDFNDDMLWLANACIRAYHATGNTTYLETATFLWNDVIQSYSDVFGGGITWKKDTPNLKNAVSNAPAIILAVSLYDIGKNTEYLDWAKSLYQWQKANLVNDTNGLVWDHITEENGEITVKKDWIFTYNQGTWIASGLYLYRATGEQQYLDDALKTAASVMSSNYVISNEILKDEGQGDGGLFKGILVRYFTELILEDTINATNREAFINFLTLNAETFYNKGLQKPEMLSGSNWSVAPTDQTDLSTQLSGVMLIEAMALLEEKNMLN